MLNESEFMSKYPPVQTGSDESDYVFDDFERAQRFDREGYQVFTIVDDGGETEDWYVEPGFHIVNKLGYIISKNKLTPAEWDAWQGAIWFKEDIKTPYDKAYEQIDDAINAHLDTLEPDELRQIVFDDLYEYHRKYADPEQTIEFVAHYIPDFDPEETP